MLNFKNSELPKECNPMFFKWVGNKWQFQTMANKIPFKRHEKLFPFYQKESNRLYLVNKDWSEVQIFGGKIIDSIIFENLFVDCYYDYDIHQLYGKSLYYNWNTGIEWRYDDDYETVISGYDEYKKLLDYNKQLWKDGIR